MISPHKLPPSYWNKNSNIDVDDESEQLMIRKEKGFTKKKKLQTLSADNIDENGDSQDETREEYDEITMTQNQNIDDSSTDDENNNNNNNNNSNAAPSEAYNRSQVITFENASNMKVKRAKRRHSGNSSKKQKKEDSSNRTPQLTFQFQPMTAKVRSTTKKQKALFEK